MTHRALPHALLLCYARTSDGQRKKTNARPTGSERKRGGSVTVRLIWRAEIIRISMVRWRKDGRDRIRAGEV